MSPLILTIKTAVAPPPPAVGSLDWLIEARERVSSSSSTRGGRRPFVSISQLMAAWRRRAVREGAGL